MHIILEKKVIISLSVSEAEKLNNRIAEMDYDDVVTNFGLTLDSVISRCDE